ncbi:MAG: chromate efflux transporter [Lautropia sp.]
MRRSEVRVFSPAPDSDDAAAPVATVPFAAALRVWLRIALLSFGGPAGQIALMHRILVDERRWIGEARFLHALNFCMLLPGPEAQQLATYIGWLMHRTAGGLIAGGLFILPGAVAILVLSWIYLIWGDLPLVTGLFFGVKAAVLAIVLQAVIRIGSRALNGSGSRLLAAASFIALFAFAVPFPVIVLAAGLIGWLATRWVPGSRAAPAPPRTVRSRPEHPPRPEHVSRPEDAPRPQTTAAIGLALWLLPTAAIVLAFGAGDVYSRIAIFFSQMALITFGGAYAVLSYVAQQAVDIHGWLTPGEMLDGLGMAETTPGPLIMVTQFVGFLAAARAPGTLPPLLAGTLGGLLTTWVTFVPSFVLILVGAPSVETLRGNRALAGALAAVTAAVVGVILNLGVWFALHSWFRATEPVDAFGLRLDLPVLASASPWAIGLSLAALLAVFRWRAGVLPTLLGCAAAGVLLQWSGVLAPSAD